LDCSYRANRRILPLRSQVLSDSVALCSNDSNLQFYIELASNTTSSWCVISSTNEEALPKSTKVAVHSSSMCVGSSLSICTKTFRDAHENMKKSSAYANAAAQRRYRQKLTDTLKPWKMALLAGQAKHNKRKKEK